MFDRALCDELKPAQACRFRRHLQECENCRLAYEGQERMMGFLRSEEGEAETGTDFENYWKALENRMEADGVDVNPAGPKTRRPRRSFPLRWVLQPAAALLLVLMGVWIGHGLFAPRSGIPEGVTGRGDADPALVRAVADYVQDSRLILLAIVNHEGGVEETESLNLPRQRELSRSLVKRADYIKGGLRRSGRRSELELVRDLELILRQIANLEGSTGIEVIREGVENRGILFKINVSDIRRSKEETNIHTL